MRYHALLRRRVDRAATGPRPCDGHLVNSALWLFEGLLGPATKLEPECRHACCNAGRGCTANALPAQTAGDDLMFGNEKGPVRGEKARRGLGG